MLLEAVASQRMGVTYEINKHSTDSLKLGGSMIQLAKLAIQPFGNCGATRYSHESRSGTHKQAAVDRRG